MAKFFLMTVLLSILYLYGVDGKVATAASETNVTNPMLGQWARQIEECKRPELNFFPTSVTIKLEADGTPTEFHYPNVSYQIKEQEVTIKLGKRHPFGKTSDKMELSFNIVDSNKVALIQLKQKTTIFVRCNN